MQDKQSKTDYHREYMRRYRAEEKTKRIAQSASKNSKLRLRLKSQEWFESYKDSIQYECVHCGEKHPACLQFHHRSTEDKIDSISHMVSGAKPIALIQAEINKCDLLCSNCHLKVHWSEKNGPFTFKEHFRQHGALAEMD